MIEQPALFDTPVDDIPHSPVPELIDTFAGRMHYTSLHCRSKACFEGRPGSPHHDTVTAIRAELVNFMGKLFDAWEFMTEGDPLTVEERLWKEWEERNSDD